MSKEIIEICKHRKDYSYPDAHVWYGKLFNAINKRYAGCLSALHYSEQINTLADIIAELAAAQQGHEDRPATLPTARDESE